MNFRQLVFLAAIAAVGVRLSGAGQPNTLTVAGPSLNQANGIAWGVTVCPDTGAVAAELAFIAQSNIQGGGTATITFENHTTLTAMCTLVVPCDIAVGETAWTQCSGAVACSPGDLVHIEWTTSACPGGLHPKGAGSGTLRQLR